jgi:hypothetical protein
MEDQHHIIPLDGTRTDTPPPLVYGGNSMRHCINAGNHGRENGQKK